MNSTLCRPVSRTSKTGDYDTREGAARLFLYRDLGIADAERRPGDCNWSRQIQDIAAGNGTGGNRHDFDFQIVS